MTFVFIKINAYQSTLYWKNLTIIKTHAIFYPILAAILKTLDCSNRNTYFEPPILPYLISVNLLAIEKILFIMIFKKKYILAHPYQYLGSKRFDYYMHLLLQ